jgi:hypothetical protein
MISSTNPMTAIGWWKRPFEIFEQTVCAAQCAYQLKVKRSGVLV